MLTTEATKELARIQAAHGGLLRAVDIVEEASHPGSPLHHYFEWDDTEAGHRWRLHQARQLVRVTVTVLPRDEPHYQVRAYVSLTPDRNQEGGGYKAMVSVLESPSARGQMIADALDELNRWKVKYFTLTELANIFAAIEKAQRDYRQPPPTDLGDNGDSAPA